MTKALVSEEPIRFHVGGTFTRHFPTSFKDREWYQQFQVRIEQYFNVVLGDGSWLRPNPGDNCHFAAKFVQHATRLGKDSFEVKRCEASIPNTVLILVKEQSSGQTAELNVNLEQLMSARHLGYFQPFPQPTATLSTAATAASQ